MSLDDTIKRMSDDSYSNPFMLPTKKLFMPGFHVLICPLFFFFLSFVYRLDQPGRVEDSLTELHLSNWQDTLQDARMFIRSASQFGDVTTEDLMALQLFMYVIQDEDMSKVNDSVCLRLNKELRTGSISTLKVWAKFIWLLTAALRKLPHPLCTVYRSTLFVLSY